ncbi:MAG: DinB family protein [Longimicrobiales bacterium]
MSQAVKVARWTSSVAAVLGMLAAVQPAAAQTSKERYVANFERMRLNVLAMVDSMPAAGLRTAPTEGVRDFAEQIEHVALGNVNLIASGIDADRIPLGLEKEVYLNDKEELKRLVNVAFDRVREMLNAMSPEDLLAEGRLFGQVPLPKWQIVEAAYEHGLWTLGATVPYVRLQGGVPHSYGIVPRGQM